MQLKILLVDDEPDALIFLEHMIVSRCSGWEVVGIAENGRQAMARIEESKPDMVLTDIRMPLTDGVSLAGKIRQNWPEIRTAIISGYEDFSAAQSAMQYGVSNYLLKPVSPAQLVETLEQARQALLSQKKQYATSVLESVISGDPIDKEWIEHHFQTNQFQAMLIRTGTLPSRYSATLPAGRKMPQTNRNIFPERSWLITGRDEKELLVFKEADSTNWSKTIKSASRFLPEGPKTIVFHNKTFPLSQASEVTTLLLRLADKNLVLGIEKKIEADHPHIHFDSGKSVDARLEQQLSCMCTGRCSIEDLRNLLKRLFDTWQQEQRPLYFVKNDITRILEIIKRSVLNAQEQPPTDTESNIDEVILLSASMDDLYEQVCDLIFSIINQSENQTLASGANIYFEKAQAYIKQNLANTLSLPELCNAMGISQTYMSRIFRRHTDLSFSEYLTRERIDRAKLIMRENPDLPLKVVAELSGYKDPLYFSKVFHRLEGMSPSQFVNKKEI